MFTEFPAEYWTEAYSEPYQTSKIERLFAKLFILDAWQGFEHVSAGEH